VRVEVVQGHDNVRFGYSIAIAQVYAGEYPESGFFYT
jgi:hypothetical protein